MRKEDQKERDVKVKDFTTFTYVQTFNTVLIAVAI